MMDRKQAFTLIELLVVVAIIVALLAMLAPALDKAIYQAELAVCGARVKAIANSVTTYAAGARRSYPYRQTYDLHKAQPSRITVKLSTFGSDDRPYLRDLLSINAHLNDPFVQAADLEGSKPDTNVFCSYSLWYQMRYPSEQGMMKLGDRFTWGGNSFRVLASDVDVIRSTGPLVYASHPDLTDTTQNTKLQDAQVSYFAQTSSVWGASQASRGPIDLNFAFDDGSVSRYESVPFDAGQPGRPEMGPITGVPEAMDGTSPTVWWHHLPKN